MSDLKKAILEVQDKKVKKVVVPEWMGFDTYVRSLNARDGLQVTQKVENKDDLDRFAWVCACVLCDENGNQIFDPSNEDDIKGLSDRSIKALITVVNAAAELNALDYVDEEEGKEKNASKPL